MRGNRQCFDQESNRSADECSDMYEDRDSQSSYGRCKPKSSFTNNQRPSNLMQSCCTNNQTPYGNNQIPSTRTKNNQSFCTKNNQSCGKNNSQSHCRERAKDLFRQFCEHEDIQSPYECSDISDNLSQCSCCSVKSKKSKKNKQKSCRSNQCSSKEESTCCSKQKPKVTNESMECDLQRIAKRFEKKSEELECGLERIADCFEKKRLNRLRKSNEHDICRELLKKKCCKPRRSEVDCLLEQLSEEMEEYQNMLKNLKKCNEF